MRLPRPLVASRRDRLLALVAAGVAVALAVIGVATFERIAAEREVVELRVRQHAGDLALGFAEQTERTIRGVDQLLRILAHEHHDHRDPAHWKSIAEAAQWDRSLLVNLAIADERGVLVGVSQAMPTTVNVADREYFRYHREHAGGETLVGEPIVGRLSGRTFVHVSRRLANPDGSFAGVVMAAVSPEYLTRFYGEAGMGGRGLVAVFRTDGAALSRRTGDSTLAGGDPACDELLAQARRSRHGILRAAGADGVMRVNGYRRLEGYPLVAVVGLDEAHAFADFARRQRDILVFGAWLALAALAAGVLLGAGIVRLQRMHRLLVESLDEATEGVFRATPGGRFLLANRSLARILGYGSPRQLVAERGELGEGEEFRRIMERDGRVTGFEYEARRRDGSSVWVSETARAVRDARGRIAWYEGTVEDVELRRRAEEAMRAADRHAIEGYVRLLGRVADLADALGAARGSAEVFRALREFVSRSAPCQAMYVSLDARCVFAWRDGRDEDVAAPPPAGAREATLVVPVKARGSIVGSLEIRSGEPGAYGSEHVTALRMAAPLAAMAIENARLLEAERALRLAAQDSERLKAAVLESAHDAIVTVDAAGRIVEFNRAAEAMFGCTRAEALGTDLIERFVPASLRQVHRDGLERRTRPGVEDARRIESRALRAGGGEFPVEVSIARIEHADPPLFTAFIRDLTAREAAEAARVQLEEQLRQSQKMEAIGRLAGGIAHDFNNIVGAILGNVELAAAEAGVQPAVRESLDEIRKAGERARDLIQQILSFSRRQPTRPLVLSLADLAAESVRLLRATLPARLRLRFAADPATPPIRADAVQIGQVVINLCVNAADAMQARTGAIEVRVEPNAAGEPTLVVRDEGRGMAPEVIERIFEPFFTTKAHGEGTGLGLPVVHGIVASHGGRIEVESEPGRGTTFRVSFPRASGEPVRLPEPLPPRPARGRGQSILYLDDDEAIVNLTRRMLRRRGYRVSAFTRQDEVLEALRRAPGAFDALVTDQNMPGLAGLEVARAARAIAPRLRVALASGYITEELEAQARAAGVSEIVFKPRFAEDLDGVLERLFAAE